MNYEELYAAQAAFFDAPWLKGCSFANEWRNEWRRVLRAAARDPQPYPPQNPAAVFPMEHTFEDTEFTFHCHVILVCVFYYFFCKCHVFIVREG